LTLDSNGNFVFTDAASIWQQQLHPYLYDRAAVENLLGELLEDGGYRFVPDYRID